MSKSVLVIDTPKNCYDCPFGTEYCGDHEYEGCCELADCLDYDAILMTEEHYDYESESRPDWCPLKPLPEKKELQKLQVVMKVDMKKAMKRAMKRAGAIVLMRLQEERSDRGKICYI